mmetsp:Transcript_22176/g.54914  ORF Transcript_22176/g.54914 Transcript_22176/m.54914 type:complete len:218 (-) Transcript_22176:757-1410(-)
MIGFTTLAAAKGKGCQNRRPSPTETSQSVRVLRWIAMMRIHLPIVLGFQFRFISPYALDSHRGNLLAHQHLIFRRSGKGILAFWKELVFNVNGLAFGCGQDTRFVHGAIIHHHNICNVPQIAHALSFFPLLSKVRAKQTMKEARNHVHVQFVAEIHGGTGLDKSSTPARSQDDDKQIQFERVGSKSIGFFSIRSALVYFNVICNGVEMMVVDKTQII